VTEHKSSGQLRAVVTLVRVFVAGDYQYGYFVDEHQLLALLDQKSKDAYLSAGNEIRLEVAPVVAQCVIDMGVTPYAKRRVA